MKLSPELNDALNTQVLKEYGNMLFYKQLESFFEDYQLTNIAKFFSKQAQEEKGHGDKLVEYINSRTGGIVTCGDANYIPMPIEFSNVGQLYVEAEEATTQSLEDIYELALDQRSFMDLGFLEDMLNEQVEEEDSASKFALNIQMCSDKVLLDSLFKE